MAAGDALDTREYATRLGACVLVGVALWLAPHPPGIGSTGWQVLAVFSAVIASFLLRPLPMGPATLIGLVVLAASGSLPLKTVLSGYGEPVVWLVVTAFLIAGAVKESGLGQRIALTLVGKLGRSTTGLGYAICGSELLLGPVVPSNTARGGGIMSPIVQAVARSLDSHPEKGARRAGDYLVLVAAHANLITAAMFLTGMAANALVSEAAAKHLGIDFTWLDWALAGLVPGLTGLLLLPLFLRWIARPELVDTREAQVLARETLRDLGPWTYAQQVTGGVFVLLIALWSTTFLHGMGSALVALLGLCVLFLSRAYSWTSALRESGAWDTLAWLGGMLAMAQALREEGVIDWFRQGMEQNVVGLSGLSVALILALIYFFSMYGFAMLTGHVAALAAAFFSVAAAAEAPPLVMVALLAAFSNLCGCLTNYSTGAVIVYFGLGYVPAARWFRVGFLVALFHLVIWLGLGLVWWKVLGWW
jgi:DASS family divalent anion:Na+ symporter